MGPSFEPVMVTVPGRVGGGDRGMAEKNVTPQQPEKAKDQKSQDEKAATRVSRVRRVRRVRRLKT